jgi:DNA-binding phage protein
MEDREEYRFDLWRRLREDPEYAAAYIQTFIADRDEKGLVLALQDVATAYYDDSPDAERTRLGSAKESSITE